MLFRSNNPPGTPNTFSLVESVVIHWVLAKVLFYPITFSGFDAIAAHKNKCAYDIPSTGFQFSIFEDTIQVHPLSSKVWNFLQPEASPFSAGKSWIGFQFSIRGIGVHGQTVAWIAMAISLASSRKSVLGLPQRKATEKGFGPVLK